MLKNRPINFEYYMHRFPDRPDGVGLTFRTVTANGFATAVFGDHALWHSLSAVRLPPLHRLQPVEGCFAFRADRYGMVDGLSGMGFRSRAEE